MSREGYPPGADPGSRENAPTRIVFNYSASLKSYYEIHAAGVYYDNTAQALGKTFDLGISGVRGQNTMSLLF